MQREAELHSRRLAAAAWLYHLGISSFSAAEYRARGLTGARWLVALALRDSILATVGRQSSSAARRVALGATVATDLVGLKKMTRSLPRDLIAEDRSISQFGLAWGLVAYLDPWLGSKRLAHIAPLAGQLATAAFWKMPPRSAARYVAFEGAWSSAVLRVTGGLRERVKGAIATRAGDAARSEADAARVMQITAGSTFFERHVHKARLPAWDAAAWNTEGADELHQLCRVEADRYRRFSGTENDAIGQLLDRLAVHRRLQGFDFTIEPSVGPLLPQHFGHAVNEQIDFLVDEALTECSEAITVSAEMETTPKLVFSRAGGSPWVVSLA